MKILNLGSMNLDDVYSVEHFVSVGETIPSIARLECCGGKGLNQSIALAWAGAQVFRARGIGPGGMHCVSNCWEMVWIYLWSKPLLRQPGMLSFR